MEEGKAWGAAYTHRATATRGPGVEASTMTGTLSALKTKPRITPRSLGALLALSLASACQPAGVEVEAEDIPLHVDRTGDTLRFSWEGDKVHRFEVIQCNEPPKEALPCVCSGALVWGLGPGESEKFHEVALQQPFLASPLQYGVTPESDRKDYAARPLVVGGTYLVTASRVGPCEEGPQDCEQVTARGCQTFVW
jgi:hypothetical protein